MRRVLLAVLLVLGTAVFAHASLNALPDKDDNALVANLGYRPSWNGGPFELTIWDSIGTELATVTTHTKVYGPEVTFCTEVRQTVSLGSYYKVYDTTATQNSVLQKLTGYAAWAYDVFEANKAGIIVNTNSTRDADLKAFQNAIWAGMATGAVGASGSAYYDQYGNTWTNTLYNSIYNSTLNISYNQFKAVGGLSGNPLQTEAQSLADIGKYTIVQLGTGNQYQDQFAIGLGGSGIPEPATIVIWSLLGAGSWLGMRVVRRRRVVSAGRQPWSPENRHAILSIIEKGRR